MSRGVPGISKGKVAAQMSRVREDHANEEVIYEKILGWALSESKSNFSKEVVSVLVDAIYMSQQI